LADHPTPAELEDLVFCRLSAERAREVISHLMDGCAVCRAELVFNLKWMLGFEEPPERVLTPLEDAAYDAALDRAFTATKKKALEIRLEQKRQAMALLDDGVALPELPPHFRGLPFFEVLLERSWSLRHENPAEMLRLAAWAQLLSQTFGPADLLEVTQIADLQCLAWIELGNAYRVADELVEAEVALSRATDLLMQGTRDELLAARLLAIQAALFGAKREFDLAETALDMAYAAYRRHGDNHLAGRVIIKKGIYAGYNGHSEEALRLLGQGLELIDNQREPGLVYLAAHNQARLLMDSGRAREARIVLFNLKAQGLDLGRVTELKLRWLEGQINAELGELERAEVALRGVKQGFEAADLGYKAALAGLELGAVLLRRGRTDDAIREVLQAADVFQSVKVKREAAASVLLLRRSFEQRTVNAVLLNRVIGLLRHGEDAAGARFEASAEE
jgi:tetratricopeptide (TPR) repeat protein